jgi:hypothetical protein
VTRYPKRSGEDQEAYYNHVHIIVLKENTGEKSFNSYWPSWEYLHDKPKFFVTLVNPANASKGRKEVISFKINSDDVLQCEGESEPFIRVRPMGRNSLKRKIKEEKVLTSVLD